MSTKTPQFVAALCAALFLVNGGIALADGAIGSVSVTAGASSGPNANKVVVTFHYQKIEWPAARTEAGKAPAPRRTTDEAWAYDPSAGTLVPTLPDAAEMSHPIRPIKIVIPGPEGSARTLPVTNGTVGLCCPPPFLPAVGIAKLQILIAASDIATMRSAQAARGRPLMGRCPPACIPEWLTFSLRVTNGVVTTNTANVQPQFMAINEKGTAGTKPAPPKVKK